MNTLKINLVDQIAQVELNRPKANAINLEMATDLLEAFKSFKLDEEVKAVWLHGSSPFFSAGLDVPELYGYDKDEIRNFWRKFHELLLSLNSFSKPLLASITGHSPAGGCVLALCADYRIMESGSFKIGLNEVPVGIVVPEPIFHLYAWTLGKRLAYASLMTGKLYNPKEALEAGLVDQVVEGKEMKEASQEVLKSMMALPPSTFSKTKSNLKNDLLRKLDQDFEEAYSSSMEAWWSEESQEILKNLIKSLGKKQ